MLKIIFQQKIYFLVLLVFLFSNNSFSQSNAENILDKKINLNIKKASLFQVCGALANFKRVPLGLEGAEDFELIQKPHINVKSGTLKEILNLLIEKSPNYKWEVSDGVINIYPIKSRDSILKKILETKINQFRSNKELGRVQIRNNILYSEGIISFLNSQQIHLGILISASLHVEDATSDINMSDTDLRGILNKVVKNSGDSKFWFIQRLKDDQSVFLSF